MNSIRACVLLTLTVAVSVVPMASAQKAPSAFAGTWEASFKYADGKSETHRFVFAADGTPMWGKVPMTRAGQTLSNEPAALGRIQWRVLSLAIGKDQIVYNLRETFTATDSWRVYRYVFRLVEGNRNKLAIQKFEVLRNGLDKRLWGQLDRLGD